MALKMITNKIFSIEKIYFEVFNFEKLNTSKSERARTSTLRDWPPCPPIQRGGGRRSRPGVTPFISALTVARCPATFPGVWPQLRDTLSTSRSVGRGTGAFIYLPPSATPAGITHYTLQAKSCAKGGTPLETPDNKTGGMLPSPGAYRRLLSAARFTVCV